MSDSTTRRRTVTFEQVQQAGTKVGIEPEQTARLWQELDAATDTSDSRSGAPAIAWYFGSGVVLVGMMLLIGKFAWDQGWPATLMLSLAYTGVFFATAAYVSKQATLHLLERILYVLAACMTPITVLCLEQIFSQHGDPETGLLLMMGAGALVGVGISAATRTSLVLLPTLVFGGIAVTTASHLAFSPNEHFSATVALYGLAVAVLGLCFDSDSEEDFGFWPHTVGALAIWFGLSELVQRGSELDFLLFALAGVVSMITSVLVSRRIYAITGGLAIIVVYFGHLVVEVFGDNIVALAIGLTALGLGTIWLGVWYARNTRAIEQRFIAMIPSTLKNRLPR